MLNRMKIGARLLTGFGLLMIVIAGLSGLATYSDRSAGNALREVVRLNGNVELDQRVEQQILQARLAIWIGLATGDLARSAQAEPLLKSALEQLDSLAARTRTPARLAAISAMRSAMTDYQTKGAALKVTGGRNTALDAPENRAVVAEAIAAAAKITEIAEPLLDSYRTSAAETTSDAETQLTNATTIAMITGIASVLAGCGVSIVISRSITGPIRSMTNAMISLAKGDLSTRIPATDGKDEIGAMARSVEVFKRNMEENERLHVANEERKQRDAGERRKMMSDLAARFEANAGGIVSGVTARATELQATAQAMAATAEETSRQSTIVAAASEQAMQNVNTVAASTEELSASVREILQQIDQSNQLTNETVKEANVANHGMQALASAMDRIGQVVGLISGIAGQTNLLALNATIEAARAGDAGKGFAVVASEVKALASQTAKATEEISTQIAAIQEATRSSVQSIQSIVARIGRVSEAATAIASAVEQQGAATNEIARNVTEAAKGTGEVSSNIAGVNEAAQNAGVAASQVLASANSLSENSEALRTQVDSFLREVRAA